MSHGGGSACSVISVERRRRPFDNLMIKMVLLVLVVCPWDVFLSSKSRWYLFLD